MRTHVEYVGRLTGFFHRTPQTMEASPVVATAFGVCEIHRVKAEDGTVHLFDYMVNDTHACGRHTF